MTQVYDYVIIGSGFGGSVSAMRLTEKGYSVLVLEKGKRFNDGDFARSNWQYWKYVWLPALRAHGILQISILKGVMVLHGAGVGGGSLGYANVLEMPTDETFATPAWNQNVKWGEVLREHYATARKMLGANCITEKVTEGSIVASGKMLLSDRHISRSEERHDEPEKQA